MENKSTLLRQIPQVERLLNDEAVAPFRNELGHGVVVSLIREAIEVFRTDVLEGRADNLDGLVRKIVRACEAKRLEKLQQVINGTGVIIHTNLGRAPLGKDLLSRLEDNLAGYTNLEFHIPTEKRGKRGGYVEELLCDLTGAEDALIVNNNASSVFLILHEFAQGKEVLVSRGELVQIGGGFRIPDIMNESGATLVEVGTTNITTLNDFRRAVTGETGMIFSVHQSNYRIEGFTESATLGELSSLKNERVIFVRDLGSGNLLSDSRVPKPFEPTVRQELEAGCDLVCFSGDKLVGACQAGIILGSKEYIGRLKKNPLMRMLRVDKVTYFLLQESPINYQNGTPEKNPLWERIFQSREDLAKRIQRCMRRISHPLKKGAVKRVETSATYGGGAMPAVTIPSMGLQISPPNMGGEEIFRTLLHRRIPIVGAIADDLYTIDFMTLFDEDVIPLAEAIEELLDKADK